MERFLDSSIPGPVLLLAFVTVGWLFWLVIPYLFWASLMAVWITASLLGMVLAGAGYYIQRSGVWLMEVCSALPRHLRTKRRSRETT